ELIKKQQYLRKEPKINTLLISDLPLSFFHYFNTNRELFILNRLSIYRADMYSCGYFFDIFLNIHSLPVILLHIKKDCGKVFPAACGLVDKVLKSIATKANI
ncbi:hypothetical protein, partial [Bacillus sp. MUM 13]|uniref:hypothetical protein n=1 Tax=Bacillus sp. MUM 13 TaxID=1678001 RepID=UPI00196B9823